YEDTMPVETLIGNEPPPERRRHHQAAEPHRGEVVRRPRVAGPAATTVAPPLPVHRNPGPRPADPRGERAGKCAVPDPLVTGALSAIHAATIRLPLVKLRGCRQPAAGHPRPRRPPRRPLQLPRYCPAGSGWRA